MNLKELYYRVAAKNLAKPQGFLGRFAMKQISKSNTLQYDFIVNAISNTKNLNVLDIGFGNGALLNLLSEKYDNSYYGIDISSDMVKLASKNAKLNLQLANVEKIPFDDDMFDIIYTCNTVYFWQDTNKAINEINRILKHDGVFYNLFYTKKALDDVPHTEFGFNKRTIQEMIELFKPLGKTKLHEIKNKLLYAIEVRKEKNSN